MLCNRVGVKQHIVLRFNDYIELLFNFCFFFCFLSFCFHSRNSCPNNFNNVFLSSFLFSDVTNAQSRRPSTIARSLGVNPKASATSADAFECPEEFGYYPHPHDCSQYYVCVFGGALLESCTGGLMYSHELQTCDWPRNVGCEASDDSAAERHQQQHQQHHSGRDLSGGRQQHDAYHVVPSKFRFSSISSSTPQTERFPETHQLRHSTIASTSVQSLSPIQQTLPPPPELRIAPNPVITSRGQPKPFENIDIAKVRYLKIEMFPCCD